MGRSVKMQQKVMLLLLPLFVGALAEDWVQVWGDEFDYFNPDNWELESTAWGGGNEEFQVYTPAPENHKVEDGKLYLIATKLADNINPKTGQPFGEDFLWSGTLDLEDLYGYCTFDVGSGCYRTGQ